MLADLLPALCRRCCPDTSQVLCCLVCMLTKCNQDVHVHQGSMSNAVHCCFSQLHALYLQPCCPAPAGLQTWQDASPAGVCSIHNPAALASWLCGCLGSRGWWLTSGCQLHSPSLSQAHKPCISGHPAAEHPLAPSPMASSIVFALQAVHSSINKG